ncbi:MAG: right-handed parallel beta-helix repeat-containing protein [Deltaproteobacteria bacterium]|nr:right-handed parallel beta-helix repeat-containing protein [Deltaproteobacteria bacterium]
MAKLRAAVWSLLLCSACSDPDLPGSGVDAGHREDASLWAPDIAEPEPPAPPTPPTPPDLPRITPCPDGWREKVDPDNVALVTCDPWPEGGRQDCAEDEARFPGRPGCERIGPACPEGEWPAELPEDARVLYVRAGEPEGGDGTRERPFGWIADAVAAASDGDVIALSKGLFDEEARIDRAVTLLGACVLETRIAPSVAGGEPAALTLRAAAAVRDLQVGGAQRGVDVSRTGDAAELHSVLVRDATEVGVTVSFRGRLRATDLVVSDTLARQGDGALGYGLNVGEGAEVTLNRTVLERNRTVGVRVADEGTALTASNLVVSDTLAQESDGAFGYGLAAQSGGEVTLDQAVLERNSAVGLTVGGEGTALTATDLVVSDTQSQESDVAGGLGLAAWGGAQVTLEGALLERNRTVGVRVADAGTALTARDVVVSHTLAQESDGDFGWGFEARGGGEVTLDRVVFDRNRALGVWIAEEDTTLVATDLVVSDTLAKDSDASGGYGLQASDGARVTLDRVAFERNQTAGVAVVGGRTVLTATDLVVVDTLAQESDALGGHGLEAWGGAEVTVDRAVFARNRAVGLAVGGDGTALTATDLTVSDTLPQESDGDFGTGLQASGGAEVTLSRAVLERNRATGVVVGEEATVLTATDLVVVDTLAQASDHDVGYGLQVSGGAHVTLERAVLERNRKVEVLVGGEGTVLTAADLVVADTPSRESDGRHGASVVVWGGASAAISRSCMVDNRDYALRASGAETTVTAVDLVVERTSQQACAVDTCRRAGGGFGLASEDGATLDVRRFRSADNALVGVLVATGSDLDLHEGIVSGNRIGVNVQVDDYDRRRLQDQVIYVGNCVNTDTARFEQSELPEMLDIIPPERR